MMEESSQWMMLLRALGSLAIVIALILALAYAARRFFKSEKWAAGFGAIRVVQSLPLGSRKKLILVEVEGQRVLVGVGGESVNGICHLGAVDAGAEFSKNTLKERVYEGQDSDGKSYAS